MQSGFGGAIPIPFATPHLDLPLIWHQIEILQ